MKHRPHEFSIRELVTLIYRGAIAVPEFQRPFVWDPSQVVDLLDSVSNGWPIGAFLMLEGPQPFETKKIDSGPEVDSAEVQYYLLDGQQRATSLFHVLTQTGNFVYFVDLSKGDPEDPPDYRWAPRKFGIPSTTRYTHSVAALMDDSYFEDVLAGCDPAERPSIRKTRDARLGYLMDERYDIPATVMDQDISLEALTRIFETLNRTGVRLDAFDLMVAVLYPSGFKLRDEWQQAQDDDPVFKQFDSRGIEILKLISLWRSHADREPESTTRPSRRVKGVRQRDVLNTPADFVESLWPRATRMYAMALSKIEEHGGVVDRRSLPSEAMVLTIAHELDVLTSGGKYQLDAAEGDEIRRWYWSAVADQRYAQGANTQVVFDAQNFASGIYRAGPPASTAEALNDELRRSRILRLGIRGLVARHGGLDPLTGDPLTGPLKDFSLQGAQNNSLAVPGSTPVADIVVCNASSIVPLRRAARTEELSSRITPAVLDSQGFRARVSTYAPRDIRMRSQVLLTWFAEELN